MPAFAIGHLTILLVLPVIGVAVLLLIPRRQSQTLFACALIASALDFFWSLGILNRFDGNSGEMQMIERIRWMPAFGIEYIVGVDGISIFLVLLTTLLMPIAILASWSVKDKVKEYFIFMLLLETGMLGAFVALDLFLFYVFWEVMLVPMYFLIGVWGGTSAHLRRAQVCHLHHGGQPAHAGGNHLFGDSLRSGRASPDL